MLFMEIPFVVENNRIERETTRRELSMLEIAEGLKDEAFEAVYSLRKRGISFDEKDIKQAIILERLLSKLGIPYRLAEVSEFA
jgi:hypothetical protein